MERLTQYFEVGAYTEKQNIIDISNNLPYFEKGVLVGKVIDKLADFEDFMEEQGFESLEELKSKIEYFEDKIKTDKFNYEQLHKYKNEIQQENQALKSRWQKLKEWLISTLKEKQNSPKYYKFNNVLNKMQELEKENKWNKK